MTIYAIPPMLIEEIDRLEDLIQRFSKGAVNENELKAHRVPFGVYEQREKGTYMVRVRCPGGLITPEQLNGVADLSLKYGAGQLHITTRQELQIHHVKLEGIVRIIRALFDIGLSSRGGGGNTVRNIMASWDAGIAADEAFDVTPYAVALTERFIAENDSWTLPRKFKISFSGSERDNAFATVNDLGFVARIKQGKRGFKVFVAGGMGRSPQIASVLHDFIPDRDVYVVARAVKNLFDRYGNRKNRHQARLRFLWRKLGSERFVQLYQEELKTLKAQNLPPLELKEFKNEEQVLSAVQPIKTQTAEFERWKRRYVRAQRQTNLFVVTLPIALGILEARSAQDIAQFARHFGPNTIRFTPQQNITLRNIPERYLGNLYHLAQQVTPLSKEPPLLGNAIACAGASTCQLGICRSRDALTALASELKLAEVDLDLFSELRLNISGCSNACGQHFLADLGFFGKVGRRNHISYPAYNIVAGAQISASGSQFAQKIEEVSARDLPVFVARFLKVYQARRAEFPSFSDFLKKEGQKQAQQICEELRPIPEIEQNKNYYFDWGTNEPFTLAGRGQGECSAGLFDLIEMDLNEIKAIAANLNGASALRNERLYRLVLLTARMLLITRGVEAKSDEQVFEAFTSHFLNSGLVDSRFKIIIEAAKSKNYSELNSLKNEALNLALVVEQLYHSMDDSLRFHNEPSSKEQQEHGQEKTGSSLKKDLQPNVVRDFRGVPCPMNFVKTKMELALMQNDQVLEILLDDGSPIENVPRSIENEGHEILEQKRQGDAWMVLIRKRG